MLICFVVFVFCKFGVRVFKLMFGKFNVLIILFELVICGIYLGDIKVFVLIFLSLVFVRLLIRVILF